MWYDFIMRTSFSLGVLGLCGETIVPYELRDSQLLFNFTIRKFGVCHLENEDIAVAFFNMSD